MTNPEPTAVDTLMAWVAEDRESRRLVVTIEACDPEYDDDTDEVIAQPFEYEVGASGVDDYDETREGSWAAMHYVARGDSFETAAQGVLRMFGS